MYRSLPTVSYLEECFAYESNSGLAVWKVRPLSHFKNNGVRAWWNSRYAGKQAGYKSKNRILVSLDDTRHLLHRLIWKLVTGHDPLQQIDHINTDPSDNRWENLREASDTQNKGNLQLSVKNSSGYKGVYKHSVVDKYVADISKKGKSNYLGIYDTVEEAARAYDRAAKEYFGEFARLNFPND